MNQRRMHSSLAHLLICLTPAGCNGVLGIEEAALDPSITSSSAGSATATATSSGTGAGSDCEEYCGAIMTACTGFHSEYTSMAVCLTICATFDPGTPGDTTGDSLQCRYGHALAAMNDPIVECQKAGPLARECTSPCSAFCQLDLAICQGDLFPYPSGLACEAICAQYPYLVSSESPEPDSVGDLSMLNGNTLNCRLYHLEAASGQGLTSAMAHCSHTGPDSLPCD